MTKWLGWSLINIHILWLEPVLSCVFNMSAVGSVIASAVGEISRKCELWVLQCWRRYWEREGLLSQRLVLWDRGQREHTPGEFCLIPSAVQRSSGPGMLISDHLWWFVNVHDVLMRTRFCVNQYMRLLHVLWLQYKQTAITSLRFSLVYAWRWHWV